MTEQESPDKSVDTDEDETRAGEQDKSLKSMVVPRAKNRLDTVTGKKMVAVLIFDALDSFA